MSSCYLFDEVDRLHLRIRALLAKLTPEPAPLDPPARMPCCSAHHAPVELEPHVPPPVRKHLPLTPEQRVFLGDALVDKDKNASAASPEYIERSAVLGERLAQLAVGAERALLVSNELAPAPHIDGCTNRWCVEQHKRDRNRTERDGTEYKERCALSCQRRRAKVQPPELGYPKEHVSYDSEEVRKLAALASGDPFNRLVSKRSDRLIETLRKAYDAGDVGRWQATVRKHFDVFTETERRALLDGLDHRFMTLLEHGLDRDLPREHSDTSITAAARAALDDLGAIFVAPDSVGGEVLISYRGPGRVANLNLRRAVEARGLDEVRRALGEWFQRHEPELVARLLREHAAASVEVESVPSILKKHAEERRQKRAAVAAKRKTNNAEAKR